MDNGQTCTSNPFGDALLCSPADNGGLYSAHTHFTGKERDAESGLDNFGARYMASTMGRFMSADPFTVTPGRVVDPQQLNLYAYGSMCLNGLFLTLQEC